jgi:transcriptional regulator with XRE-family HTH domain
MHLTSAEIRKRHGLRARELAALIGVHHTIQTREEKEERCGQRKLRPKTLLLYWLLARAGTVSEVLDFWLYEKPKNEDQCFLLIQIGKRFKGNQYCAWEKGMRTAHPEFFH